MEDLHRSQITFDTDPMEFEMASMPDEIRRAIDLLNEKHSREERVILASRRNIVDKE